MNEVGRFVRQDDTIVRLGGNGYISALTWTADGRQLVAALDGCGWPETADNGYFNSCLFAIDGHPRDASVNAMPGYPGMSLWTFATNAGAPYYAFGGLSANGTFYQFLSTYADVYDLSSYRVEDRDAWGGADINYFANVKLIYSADNGRSWCNQDGTPVRLELPQEQSHENMVFFQEPEGAFSQLSFLQMGRDYEQNMDGYLYVYSPNGRIEGKLNELVMFRVEKDKIRDREAYEYFVEVQRDGSARWTRDISERGVVHTFPTGLEPKAFPFGVWLPSVVYNAPLGIYMMANCSGIGGDCVVPDPTYLGFWIARHPWGPWTQIHEEAAWTPGRDPHARATGPQIAPRWLAEDGRSFWLVWTDVQSSAEEAGGELSDSVESIFTFKDAETWKQSRMRWRQLSPYFGLNMQRVDVQIK
jgi:hypothetical protein